MAWPAILREVVSVGAVERRAGLLWLTPTTQRLHSVVGTGCRTTVFTEPGEPGETSGAAAVVAGCLAALVMRDPGLPAEELVRLVLHHRRPAQDDSGLGWAAVDVKDVLSGF
jgi:hypothetical protein